MNKQTELLNAIEQDIEQELYDGACVIVAKGGEILLHEAIGYAERATKRQASRDDIYLLFSLTKGFTGIAALAQVAEEKLHLDTPVAEIIPEFAKCGKQRITLWNLLTHTAGLSANPPVAFEDIDDLEAVVQAICNLPIESRPGQRIAYSPVSAHAIIAEMVRRVDPQKRSFQQILKEDYFIPLDMQDTSLGKPENKHERIVPVVYRDRTPGALDPKLMEAYSHLLKASSEVPASGSFSTAKDLFRWTEMLRCQGEYNGRSFLPAAMLEKATTNQTGEMSNGLFDYMREMHNWDDFPAYLGLSFFLRGEGAFPTHLGTKSSPRTYGCLGAGSTLYWIDPKRDLTFIFLSAGLLEEGNHILRLQRLSDIVQSSY